VRTEEEVKVTDITQTLTALFTVLERMGAVDRLDRKIGDAIAPSPSKLMKGKKRRNSEDKRRLRKMRGRPLDAPDNESKATRRLKQKRAR